MTCVDVVKQFWYQCHFNDLPFDVSNIQSYCRKIVRLRLWVFHSVKTGGPTSAKGSNSLYSSIMDKRAIEEYTKLEKEKNLSKIRLKRMAYEAMNEVLHNANLTQLVNLIFNIGSWERGSYTSINTYNEC